MHRHSVKPRLTLVALTACAALIVLLGCKSVAPPVQSAADGTIVVPQPISGGTLSCYIGEPTSIDPSGTTDSSGAQVDDAIFDSLLRIDPLDSSKLLPSAAETWTSNADSTVWTFKLNPNDRFHEGTLVTANDFVYAWNRIVDPKTAGTLATDDTSAIAAQLEPIAGWAALREGVATEMSGLKALDSRTLEVTLSDPFADFDYVVAQPALAPVPQKYVEAGVYYEGKKVPYAEMPIGNGPFKMSAPWRHHEGIKVFRNDDYYGVRPYLDAVDFRIFANPKTGYAQFGAGWLDFAPVPVGQGDTAVATGGVSVDGHTADPGHQVLQGAEYDTLMIAFNNTDELLSNPNVRKAITLAINRKPLCEDALGGAWVPADNVVPTGVPGYEPGAWKDARYDLNSAKAALATAGYPKGKGLPKLTLTFVAQSESASATQSIRRDLAAIGVRATLAPLDAATYLERIRSGAFQAALLDWSADLPTMDYVMNSMFAGASVESTARYSSAAFDRGLAAARATEDRDLRMARYQRLNTQVAAANPLAPLAFSRYSYIASSRVHDLVFSGRGIADFTKVWLSDGVAK